MRSAGLFENLDNLAKPVEMIAPKSMERLGQGYGYIMYESEWKNGGDMEKLRLYGANDRANVFVDEKPVATLYDRELLDAHTFEPPVKKGEKLSILVENMGRVNFGPALEKQRKGIDQCVTINDHQHYHWKAYCLPMEDLTGLDFSKQPKGGAPGFYEFTFDAEEAGDTFLDFEGWGKAYCLPMEDLTGLDFSKQPKGGAPGFYEFTFDAEEAGDTFLDFEGWGKGCAFINGFNLGRFWEIGPQKRLYIPAPLLKKGENTILIFETEGKAPGTIELCDEPDLG